MLSGMNRAQQEGMLRLERVLADGTEKISILGRGAVCRGSFSLWL